MKIPNFLMHALYASLLAIPLGIQALYFVQNFSDDDIFIVEMGTTRRVAPTLFSNNAWTIEGATLQTMQRHFYPLYHFAIDNPITVKVIYPEPLEGQYTGNNLVYSSQDFAIRSGQTIIIQKVDNRNSVSVQNPLVHAPRTLAPSYAPAA